MKVYITRHGQSMTNVDADIGSPFALNNTNNVLTPVGVEQALEFGRKLRVIDANIQHIVASPYARTMQTAFCIASVVGTCVPISFEHDIREIGWELHGEWHRQEEKDPHFDYRSITIDHKAIIDHKRGAVTLETQREVYERAVPALKAIAAEHTGKDILIVTHYFVLRALKSYLEHDSPDFMLDYDPRNLDFNCYEM